MGGLLAPLFAPDAMLEAVSDRAWLEAMLEFEAALAAAQARAGVIPGEAADRIAACCEAERFDPDDGEPGGRMCRRNASRWGRMASWKNPSILPRCPPWWRPSCSSPSKSYVNPPWIR